VLCIFRHDKHETTAKLVRGNTLPPNFHTGFVKISQVTFAMAKGSRSLDPLANYTLGLPSPTNIPSLKASRHRKYQLISANIFHSISGMYDKRSGHVQAIQSILTNRRVLVESLLCLRNIWQTDKHDITETSNGRLSKNSSICLSFNSLCASMHYNPALSQTLCIVV